MESSYFANLSILDPIHDSQNNPSEVWLFASAWGWNSNHRVGHLTASQLTEPNQVQRSKKRNYISCAAGKHHSLLVSDRGIIYSFGDGRKGQLGYGNLFTGEASKGGVVQSTPASITPTGNLKFGRDIQCIEVQGGGCFSIAREASPEEGSKRVVGFIKLEKKMIEYMKVSLRVFLSPIYASILTHIVFLSSFFSTMETLLPFEEHGHLFAKSALRSIGIQNSVLSCFTLIMMRCRISEGVLIAWGTGVHGELGLGKDVKYSPYPMVNTKLRDICVTKIAAGERHVLAVDNHGRLFSWGCGTSGRLGHGDFEDRFVPELVRFFAAMVVTHVSAGDAHSAVMTIGRNVPGMPCNC